MQFTLKEWNFIKFCLEVAEREFKKQREACKVPENDAEYENSQYAIYRRQEMKAASLAQEIENTPL